MQSQGEILIYKAKDGSQQLEVKLEEETVWLNSETDCPTCLAATTSSYYKAFVKHS